MKFTARTTLFLLSLCAAPLTIALPAIAHEYWIEPREFVLETPGKLLADAKNGQFFKSSNFSYIPRQFDFFKVTGPLGETPVEGRAGDVPAVDHTLSAPGLYLISYQGKFDKITFRDEKKIVEYFDYEGLDGALERHLERGLAADRLREFYARSAKALVQVGPVDPDGFQDKLTGLKFELVAEKNPYALEPGDNLPVRLYLAGEPVADKQIRIFRFDGELENTTTRTDAEGRALIPLKAGGKYLLNAVHLYEGDEDPETDIPEWYSDWASLTFGISGTDVLLELPKDE